MLFLLGYILFGVVAVLYIGGIVMYARHRSEEFDPNEFGTPFPSDGHDRDRNADS